MSEISHQFLLSPLFELLIKKLCPARFYWLACWFGEAVAYRQLMR
ncbi:hypothetical protein M6B38_342080 [Iris pallida]|uniref:Uncharacterized protein n=1 Tax=Iris pallida TaxID=29817 RepID=A0AAX6GX31_IRIPA|nr:hypothetical protein M6B38_342080 [Iris pallida]